MHIPFIILFLNLGGGEILLVVLVVVMFFGTDKLPEVMRAVGKGMKDMKNATAEIQREIENSSAEIQRELNVQQHLDELKEAGDKLTGRLNEGLKDLEDHHNPTTEISEAKENTDVKIVEEEKENPLTPPTSLKRD